MASKRDRVFPDTATLYPISIADLVLRLAEAGVIELVWSDHLLDETTRVLVERKGLQPSAAAYFCDCIRTAFPDGHIQRGRYQHLLATRLGPDPDDHEHAAAASAAADVLLSADKRGFPLADTSPAVRRHPDDYLSELLASYPIQVIAVLHDMATSKRAPTTRHDILDALARAGLTTFAENARTLTA